MSILLLLVAPALAGEPAGPLVWKWTPGQVVRYHTETLLTTPGSSPYLAPRNEDATAVQVELVLDLACTGTAQGKGVALLCDIEKAQLAGVARKGDQEKLDRIFGAYSAALADCTVQMTQLPDGRISDVDLEGYANTDDRSSTILDTLRLLTRRAVAPLDLQLPKGGVDPGKAWKQTGTPLAAEAYGAYGVTGGLTMKSQVVGTDASGAHIETSATGNLTIARRDRDLGDVVNLTMGAEARFDPSTGTLAYRSISTSMEDIGAGIQTSAWNGYKALGWIARWDANGVLEGPDGPIAPEPAPPTGP